jgi:Fic family protein
MTRSAENLQHLLKEVDERKKELDALRPMRREDEERLWKKLRLEWNYNSNHLEGNTLTYQETELVLIFDQAPGGTHSVREIEEMKAHDVAVALIREWADDDARELTETDIRDLNRILLVRPFWKEALTPDGQPTRRLISIGDYKSHPNSVRLSTGEMFHYATPEETPRKMAELVTWYRKASAEQHPLLAAARLHYDFVRIHPFDDGNGRVSRLLMNYHLLRNGFPPVVIKSADKNNYLAALQRADVGDFEAFAVYIAGQLLWSLDLSIRAAKGAGVEEMGDWEKEVSLKEKAWKTSVKPLPKSYDLLIDRLDDSFWPLLWDLEHRTNIFDVFYAKAGRRIIVATEGNTIHLSFSEFKDFIEQKNTDSINSLVSIKAICTWQKYLPDLNLSNDLQCHIEIRFSEFQYHIFSSTSAGSNSAMEKKYTEPLLPFEKEGIMEKIGKPLAEKVRL